MGTRVSELLRRLTTFSRRNTSFIALVVLTEGQGVLFLISTSSGQAPTVRDATYAGQF